MSGTDQDYGHASFDLRRIFRDQLLRLHTGFLSAHRLAVPDLVHDATCLHACYAMSGIDKARGALCLRAPYAMSGPDMSHRPICPVLTQLIVQHFFSAIILAFPGRQPAIMLSVRYAMSSTGICHCAADSAVLASAMLPSAMCGTDPDYAPTL
eukprot:3938547-Rhodomonas_salina.3